MRDFEQHLASAMTAWQTLLGVGRVQNAAAAGDRYGPCTMGVQRRIAAALLPESEADVVELVKIAARFGIPLYPISTGHNWGYGAANPVRDDCVVVDLARMNRILDFDPETGLVVLEPGVTQADLSNFLETAGHPYMVPTTGAGPACSLVGNALERGYGITPIADHFAAVTCIEAVLADGRLYRSALSELGGKAVDQAFKWGLGPYLDGLFSQGSFGIVTRMTLALAKRPRGFTSFFFHAAHESGLESLVEATRAVQSALPGVVGSMALLNSLRVLAMSSTYPREEIGPDRYMPLEVIARLRTQNRVAPWTGVGALYGEPEVVSAAKKVIERTLRPSATGLFFMTPRRAVMARRLAEFLPGPLGPRLRRKVEVLQGTLDIMRGKPSDVALRLAYWRKGLPDHAMNLLDPSRDGCGLIWYSPLVPMKGSVVREYVTDVETICRAHGIEPLVTLATLSDRCFDSTVPLLFDRNDPAQLERAQQCFQALFQRGQQKGFLPYRLGIRDMEAITSGNAVCWDMVRRIKAALDPEGIMAPGRYAPAASPFPTPKPR